MGLQLYIWVLGKKKKFSFFLSREGTYIENCFGTIEGLPIGFNSTEGILASQNSYGFTAIYFVSRQEKKVQFFLEQGGYLYRKLLQYDCRPTYRLSVELMEYLGSTLLWV